MKGHWGQHCPSSRTFPCPESGTRQQPSLKTPHSLETNCSGCLPLVGATELCLPKPPDFKTVSSPRLSLRSPHRPTVNLMKMCMLARSALLYIICSNNYICMYIYLCNFLFFLSFLHVSGTETPESNSLYVHTYLGIKSDSHSDILCFQKNIYFQLKLDFLFK